MDGKHGETTRKRNIIFPGFCASHRFLWGKIYVKCLLKTSMFPICFFEFLFLFFWGKIYVKCLLKMSDVDFGPKRMVS